MTGLPGITAQRPPAGCFARRRLSSLELFPRGLAWLRQGWRSATGIGAEYQRLATITTATGTRVYYRAPPVGCTTGPITRNRSSTAPGWGLNFNFR